MRDKQVSRWVCGAALAAAATFSYPARAQSVALNKFEPAPAGDRMFGVESPYAASFSSQGASGEGNVAVHAAVYVDYGHNPYALQRAPSLLEPKAVVGDQLFMHVSLSLALFKRLTLNLSVPAAVVQDGDDPTFNGRTYLSPHAAGFGDLRVAARVRIFGEYNSPFQLGVGGMIWVPVQDQSSYLSDGKVRGMPSLLLGGMTDDIVWSFNAGVQIRSSFEFDGIAQGTSMHFGAGLAALLGSKNQVQIGPEVRASFVTKEINRKTTNVELLLGAKYRMFDDLEAGVAAGPGLTVGLGTPDIRFVGMIAYTPNQKKVIDDRDKDGVPDTEDKCPDEPAARGENAEKPGCPPAKDSDGDGVDDEKDACPNQPGPVERGGCPAPKDTDGDGVTDDVDACPADKGVPQQDPKKNGCPLPKDTDGDGIMDDKDACPNHAGKASNDPKEHGCPGDTDGDGIRDDKDACPGEKGAADPDPHKNGCPKAVRVKGDEIIILQQVEFDTGTARIKPVSNALLAEVAGVLKEHPEILKVEVQGHTDNKGAPKLNKGLSGNRADAVTKALIKLGIDKKRLVSKGYGEEKPIADNNTEDGRAKNRRVQFVVIERKK